MSEEKLGIDNNHSRAGLHELILLAISTLAINVAFIYVNGRTLDPKIYGSYAYNLSLIRELCLPAGIILSVATLFIRGVPRIVTIFSICIILAIAFAGADYALKRSIDPNSPTAHGLSGDDTRAFLKVTVAKSEESENPPEWDSYRLLDPDSDIQINFLVLNYSEKKEIENGEIHVRLIPKPGGQVLISGTLSIPGFTNSEAYSTVFSTETTPVKISTENVTKITVFRKEDGWDKFKDFTEYNSSIDGSASFTIGNINIGKSSSAHYRFDSKFIRIG